MASEPRPKPSEPAPARPPQAAPEPHPAPKASAAKNAPKSPAPDLRVRSLRHENDASGGH